MKRRETFGPGDLNVQAGFTSNMISGGASEDYDTLKEIEEKVKSNTEDINQNKTDILSINENIQSLDDRVEVVEKNDRKKCSRRL